jgi:hypothetical protein
MGSPIIERAGGVGRMENRRRNDPISSVCAIARRVTCAHLRQWVIKEGAGDRRAKGEGVQACAGRRAGKV